jgi:ribosomal protein L34E
LPHLLLSNCTGITAVDRTRCEHVRQQPLRSALHCRTARFRRFCFLLERWERILWGCICHRCIAVTVFRLRLDVRTNIALCGL